MFGYIPTCSDAEREARRRSVFGEEEPFDADGWGLYKLGKSSRSRRGWGKPTEPIDCYRSVGYWGSLDGALLSTFTGLLL